MAESNRNPNSYRRRRAGAALVALLTTQLAVAAANAPSLEGPLSWSADVVTSDFRSDTLDLSGNVRVIQGPASIESQSAKGRSVRADASRWSFEKAVHIKTAEADLQSNLATAGFVNGQIADARVEGTPARFEQRGGDSNRQVRGRAGVIEYDFNTGVVKLSNQVWFSNGKDEFRGDVVIYSVRDERVQINPGGRSSGRVRGIIRPKQNGTQGSGQPSQGSRGDTASTLEPRDDAQLATDGGGA